MTTERQVAIKEQDSSIVEQVVMHGDLAELTPKDRVAYYARVCNSLGLNPFTSPFEFIKLNNKLTLYARRDATDQLRSLKGVSVEITNREVSEGVYVVTAKARIGDRVDESIGAVDIANLKGEFKANAMMKAETKAKRRVTLSIVGLGWLDETEVADIPKGDVQKVNVNMETGEIVDKQLPEPAKNEPQAPEKKHKPLRDPSTLKNTTELVKACCEDWPATFKSSKDVLKKLGANSMADLTEPAAICYQKIAGLVEGEILY